MNNDPANVAAALRSIVIYAACALIAIIIGVLMANPMTYSSLGFIGILCAVLCIPILMRWHHPLMILSWYMPVTLFFLKGDPNLFLVMITLSLAATIVERAMGQKRFINVPQVTWPLFLLIGVVMITAKLTGGLGLRAFGSEVYGGKKYIFLVVAILGYFAIASRPIPPEKARKYVALYFGGMLLCTIQDFYTVAPHFLLPLYWLIPPNIYTMGEFELGTTRLAGTGSAAAGLMYILMARYGLRGIFLSGKLWRPVVFFISFVLIFLGGFRSAIVGATVTFFILFFLEGLQRTRMLPFIVIVMLAGAGLVIPFGSKLPFTFQRALCILPPSVVHLSADARQAADDSWDWRVRMWTALLPEIPKHLLLGKGYAISQEDFNAEMGMGAAIQNTADPAQQGLALASDYHNGPLSVVLPFGIWGVIMVAWFLASSIWVMYRNYRYSTPELKSLNAFLLATYLMTVINFYGGSLATNMNMFTGLLGLSVAINRGVCRKPVEQANNIPFSMPLRRRALQPSPAPHFPLPNRRFN
jgi:hypothetical protein